MKILVLAEINNGELAEDQTRKTVSAAATLGKVDVLCASSQCSDASTNVAKMENVENLPRACRDLQKYLKNKSKPTNNRKT